MRGNRGETINRFLPYGATCKFTGKKLYSACYGVSKSDNLYFYIETTSPDGRAGFHRINCSRNKTILAETRRDMKRFIRKNYDPDVAHNIGNTELVKLYENAIRGKLLPNKRKPLDTPLAVTFSLRGEHRTGIARVVWENDAGVQWYEVITRDKPGPPVEHTVEPSQVVTTELAENA